VRLVRRRNGGEDGGGGGREKLEKADLLSLCFGPLESEEVDGNGEEVKGNGDVLRGLGEGGGLGWGLRDLGEELQSFVMTQIEGGG